MTEELDSSTPQIFPAESNHSIWLDDDLIYADQPDLDNRIGRLKLPMAEWERAEPIIISLPLDYQGRTLTIAQSFPEYAGTLTLRALPVRVLLYFGYAYESRLISESFLLAIVCAAAFAVGAFMLAAFVRQRDMSLLCLGVAALLWMLLKLTRAWNLRLYAPRRLKNYPFPMPIYAPW